MAWQSLAKEQYINLSTFRKTGVAVATPVWFAEHDGNLYIYSGGDSGKVKRIRNNGRVELAACNARGVVHGPVLPGHARLLSGDEAKVANTILNRKYFLKRLFDVMRTLRRGTAALIEIVPG